MFRIKSYVRYERPVEYNTRSISHADYWKTEADPFVDEKFALEISAADTDMETPMGLRGDVIFSTQLLREELFQFYLSVLFT